MRENKEIKVRLSTVVYLFIILVLVGALGVVYYLGFVKDDVKNILSNKEEIEISPYEKYDDLYWYFKNSETDNTKIVFNTEKIQIEEGVAYLYSGDSKTPINSIEGKAKSIKAWGTQTVVRVYILTEEGTMWKTTYEGLNSNFVKINIDEKVLDMTDGEDTIRAVEPPYFLLANGKLVNEEGRLYEELDEKFEKSLGYIGEQIFIKSDNTMYTFNCETRKYNQIKDEKDNIIKEKDSFLLEGTTGFIVVIITENDKLYCFNGYTLEEYENTRGKKIESVQEKRTRTDDGYEINMKITFTDGTEKILENIQRDFSTVIM